MDYQGVNQHHVYHPLPEGYIISHMGSENYWSNINSTLTIPGFARSAIIELHILRVDFRNSPDCRDSLLIYGGHKPVIICAGRYLTKESLVLTGATLSFTFSTGFSFTKTGQGFLLYYKGKRVGYGWVFHSYIRHKSLHTFFPAVLNSFSLVSPCFTLKSWYLSCAHQNRQDVIFRYFPKIH